MAVDPKVLNTIQNLLARANHHNANEHEAQVCLDKVQEILLKHGLDMTAVKDADARQGKTVEPSVVHQNVWMGVSGHDGMVWPTTLGTAVAYACMCQCLYQTWNKTIVFIGDPTNVTVAIELYKFIVAQIERFAHQEFFRIPSVEGLRSDQVRQVTLGGRPATVPLEWRYWHTRNEAYRGINAIKAYRSFFEGAAGRIATRLSEDVKRTRQGLDTTGQVTALVKVTTEMIKDYTANTFGRLTTFTTKSAPGSAEAREAGRRAGDRVDIHGRKGVGPGRLDS